MAMCWVCRKKLGQVLGPGKDLMWAKCSTCNKTREQREPPAKIKQQPPPIPTKLKRQGKQ